MNIKRENKDLLEVAEMYRDQMRGTKAENGMAYIMTDNAIKDWYKTHECPHRLKYVKITQPSAGGCETSVIYCPDCETNLSEPETDC